MEAVPNVRDEKRNGWRYLLEGVSGGTYVCVLYMFVCMCGVCVHVHTCVWGGIGVNGREVVVGRVCVYCPSVLDVETPISLSQEVKWKDGSPSTFISEYIYRPESNSTQKYSLCSVDGFQWDRHTRVNMVVTVKNLGSWVLHLIRNMEDVSSSQPLVCVQYVSDKGHFMVTESNG